RLRARALLHSGRQTGERAARSRRMDARLALTVNLNTMAKKRVHEIAKEQGLTSKELLAKLNAAGIEAKAAASSVEEAVALEVLGNGASAAAQPAKAEPGDDADAKPDGQEKPDTEAEQKKPADQPGGDGPA